MKRILNFAFVAFAFVFATSCLNDVEDGAASGDMVDVVFNVSMEAESQTRAVIGENPTWEKSLVFGVYHDDVLLRNVTPEITDFGTGTTARVKVTLAKNESYDFMFWAAAPGDAYYSVDLDKAEVTVNYADDNANDEKRDAWYTVEENVLVTDDMPMRDIVLRRPLAQINVGTTAGDYADAVNAGVSVDKTSVKLSNVPNKLDLFSGVASGEVEITFAETAIPSSTLTVRKGQEDEKEYRYLSMNYILVGDGSNVGEKATLNNFAVTFYDGSKNINTVNVTNVPVRRNWRTNIVSSSMLTGDAQFNVVIEPGFFGEYYGNGNSGFEELEYQTQNN